MAKPTKSSEQYDEVIGAYVSLYIDYKGIDGAFKLAKLHQRRRLESYRN
ncbi:MAG: hypothetical protein ACI8WA_001651 [Polaribacter sp.]